MFDPALIPDDACAEGHLDADPIFQVLMMLGQKLATGRLTIADAAGDNHMYFMQGRPVGVHLAEHFHPLGQLLLELGKMTGAMFVGAQRVIAEGNRLPGQVYKELGILDDPGLKDVLAIQARRKAEHFCRLGSRAFTFCRGLTYLTGFTSTPLDSHAVIFLAVRQQMGEQTREAWLENARTEQVRLVPPGPQVPDAPVVNGGLPVPLSNYGFGAPEERFLQRICAGFESVAELAETGTLPRDDMAVLLRYLEVIGRLQRRTIPPPNVPAQISALTNRPPEIAELAKLALKDPTSEDVFSRASSSPGGAVPPPRPPRPPPPVVDEEPLFSTPSATTNPRRPAVQAILAPNPLNDPTPPQQPSIVVSEDLPAPVVKKKKVKRTEALPSESSGVLVSETRREKTEISQLPTIVIDED